VDRLKAKGRGLKLEPKIVEKREWVKIKRPLTATNRKGPPAEIVWWYNQRGELSENLIKALTIGFGMEWLPCGTFTANAVFFCLRALADNLFVLFKLLALPSAWRRCQKWALCAGCQKVAIFRVPALYPLMNCARIFRN